MARSNRETIARLGGVEVAGLPLLPDGSPASLRAGGADLPLAAWLPWILSRRARSEPSSPRPMRRPQPSACRS